MSEDVIEEGVVDLQGEGDIAVQAADQGTEKPAGEQEQAVKTNADQASETDSGEPLKAKTNKRIRDLIAERDEWKRKALESSADKPAPTLEQFDHDIEKFTAAAVEHQTQAAEAKRTEDAVKRIDAQAQAEMVETFQRDVAAKKSIYPDFDQVFHPNLPVSPQLAEVVVTSEDPAGVAYYLGKHPDLLGRLNALPAYMQGYEIAKIESMVATRTVPTKAPAPMATKVVPTGAAGTKSYDEMSDAEFAATRSKERAAWRSQHGY